MEVLCKKNRKNIRKGNNRICISKWLKFYRRHYELISKFNVGLKTLFSEGFRNQNVFDDLVYKFKKLIGGNDFSFQFRKIITRYIRIGYNLNVMRQSACLVFNPIMVDKMLPSLIVRRWVGLQTVCWPRHKAIHCSWFGTELLFCCLAHQGSTGAFLLLRVSVSYLAPRDLHRRAAY